MDSNSVCKSALPTVQWDANIRALSEVLTPLIMEQVKECLPASSTSGKDANRSVRNHLEEDAIELFPNCDDLSDGESCPVAEPASKQVDEATSDLLSDCYVSRPLANQARREILAKYHLPAMNNLKTPKLDASMARLGSKGEVQARGRVLSKFQRLTLDVAAPIISIVDKLATGEPKVMTTSMIPPDALRLLGNVHAHYNVERRQSVLKHLNPDLQHLASEDHFDSAAPSRLDPDFAKTAKESAEAMSALREARPKSSGPQLFIQKWGAPQHGIRDSPVPPIPFQNPSN